jgi:hypothetical protein
MNSSVGLLMSCLGEIISGIKELQAKYPDILDSIDPDWNQYNDWCKFTLFLRKTKEYKAAIDDLLQRDSIVDTLYDKVSEFLAGSTFEYKVSQEDDNQYSILITYWRHCNTTGILGDDGKFSQIRTTRSSVTRGDSYPDILNNEPLDIDEFVKYAVSLRN